ncbi:MAG: bifunctional folylpolyglutamate synthase/dihydrofolate synthase [Oscillospiraceae bacterium]|nr:bifunctional folylpolyglutamate synthase/dihydrofolate synthase [Oscillospiraceae bacterium]
MTYKKAIEYIESLKSAGMKLGLGRIRRVLSLCGDPHRHLKFIHVAGTNGKGSVSRMIQSILTAAGYRVGLFCSPAVSDLRDTITVDGVPVSKHDFGKITAELCSLQENMRHTKRLTEFEFLTALAFLYFEQSKTDICVVECGLGGQDDATNVIPPPLVAVFTPISLDHSAVLGETIAEIASIKCGIIKSPCKVVTSPVQHEDALAVIMQKAAEKGLSVNMPSSKAVVAVSVLPGFTEFEYDSMKIELPLTGIFQADNALTAIEAVRTILQNGFSVTRESIIKGLSGVTMPCRQEVLRCNPLVMVDGAHNTQGVAALVDTLRRLSIHNLTLVCGMLADKDTAGCMSLLAPFCRRVICCTPDNPRALQAQALADILKSTSPSLEVKAIDCPADALELALRYKEPLLVSGSFYVACALRPILLKHINDKIYTIME